MNEFSIVIPAFNEADNLNILIEEIFTSIDSSKYTFEMIIVLNTFQYLLLIIFSISVDLDIIFIILPLPPKKNKFLKFTLQWQPCIASGGNISLIFHFLI